MYTPLLTPSQLSAEIERKSSVHAYPKYEALMADNWAMVVEALRYQAVNNDDCDGTDAAHPAYWRGSDSACASMAIKFLKLATSDECDAGVFGSQELQKAKEAIIELRKERDELRMQVSVLMG